MYGLKFDKMKLTCLNVWVEACRTLSFFNLLDIYEKITKPLNKCLILYRK